ncbi:MAG: hypothetical protein ACKVQW_05495 [Pyrinomonadaceae bacterium]
MRTFVVAIGAAANIFFFNIFARAQADEICREYGETPTRELDPQG